MIFFKTKIEVWKEKLSKPYTIRESYDLPESISRRTVFIIGNQESIWLLAFQCPCGCKKIIQLNLLKDVTPSWSYSIQHGKITIRPSIWKTNDCKSHFLIKNGKIHWVDSFV
jgi:hypothetical protein